MRLGEESFTWGQLWTVRNLRTMIVFPFWQLQGLQLLMRRREISCHVTLQDGNRQRGRLELKATLPEMTEQILRRKIFYLRTFQSLNSLTFAWERSWIKVCFPQVPVLKNNVRWCKKLAHCTVYFAFLFDLITLREMWRKQSIFLIFMPSRSH